MAGQLGYCGLDRQRKPLQGDEIRACWEAADAASVTVAALPGVGPVWPFESGDTRTAVRELQFVEVEPGPQAAEPAAPIVATPSSPAEPGWSLWGEAEV